jgi:hypothetical protein
MGVASWDHSEAPDRRKLLPSYKVMMTWLNVIKPGATSTGR